MKRFVFLLVLFLGLLGCFYVLPDPDDKQVAAFLAIVVMITGIVHVGSIE